MNGSDPFERRAMALFSQALERDDDEREAWLRQKCAGDDALLNRVLTLLNIDSSDTEILRTGGAGQDTLDDPDPERAGAYRIIGLIGRGGMGAVYEGERDTGDFQHRVAIKIIRRGALSDSLITRFETERQILARLGHPNIARLFDGGYLDDGSPFMVMEFVDGAPVLDWADDQSLSLPQRLELFSAICEAIAHAHRNMIVHRDITPSNVLVTNEGIVKVIDFGIARPQISDPEDEAAQSVTSFQTYTPGYAAPERLAGANVNALSDVFSLGKLLKDLTAGYSSADLTALIDRATATSPEDRYTSVDALLDDLQRLQSGRVLAARGRSLPYTFSRFVGRNKAAVTLASVALVSLVAGLITTTILYQRAEAERAAADQRFSQVRSLASFMMFDLYDELEKISGNTRTISMLADEADNYLQSLANDERASLEVKLDTVNGLKRLADIMGNPKNQNMGKRIEAGPLLEQALQEAEDLLAQHPDNDEVKRSLADIAFSAATHTYVTSDKYDLAHDEAVRSAELWAELAARPDASFNDERQAVRAYMLTAVPLPWMGQHKEAIDILKTARQRGQDLVSAHPDEIEAVNLLGSINVELARAIVRARGSIDSEEHDLPYWNDAIRLRHEAYERDPDAIGPYRSLVAIYIGRAASWRGLEEYDEAYEDTLSAERIAVELLEDDPDDAWIRRHLGGIREEKIRTLSYAGRHEEAVDQADDVLENAHAEFKKASDDVGIKREFAYALVLIAEVYDRAGKTAQMCETAAEARLIWDELDVETDISELDRQGSIDTLQTLEQSCE
ncbi:serine/threonine-protein kinase [Henriciella sp. AS95]|uniref:serine/threonine-protein kinase n=1 Tax=Henriciella sp. AS95 TaxID=3135782 RepID=UPI00317FE7C3